MNLLQYPNQHREERVNSKFLEHALESNQSYPLNLSESKKNANPSKRHRANRLPYRILRMFRNRQTRPIQIQPQKFPYKHKNNFP